LQVHIYVILIPILLLMAAFFAASEASLFSISRAQLETLRSSRPYLYRCIQRLTLKPDALLSTIIVGNECLNILIGTVVAVLIQFHFQDLPAHLIIVASVLVSSALLLTFSEVLPKVIAFRMPLLTVQLLAYPMAFAHKALSPLRKIFLTVSQQVIRLFGIEPKPPAVVNEKDFLTLVEVGAESGSLENDEKTLIRNVFNFTDTTAASVMTPWEQVIWVPSNMNTEKAISELKSHQFSRIPVVSAKNNRVLGVLHAKELLKQMLSEDTKQLSGSVLQSSFAPYFVSTHKKISALFREFKFKKTHMAVIVDEYGKHLGIVTLEDVLNALFKTQEEPKGKTL